VQVFQRGRGAWRRRQRGTCQPATWTWAVSGDVAVTTYSSRRAAAMPAIVSTSLPASILVGDSLWKCSRRLVIVGGGPARVVGLSEPGGDPSQLRQPAALRLGLTADPVLH